MIPCARLPPTGSGTFTVAQPARSKIASPAFFMASLATFVAECLGAVNSVAFGQNSPKMRGIDPCTVTCTFGMGGGVEHALALDVGSWVKVPLLVPAPARALPEMTALQRSRGTRLRVPGRWCGML
jgi:hypothetical protein